MPQLVTITSKRQFTIPVSIFRELNLKEGEKVLVSRENGAIRVEPVLSLIERLAGSIKVPSKLKGLSPDALIEKAKKEYFSQK